MNGVEINLMPEEGTGVDGKLLQPAGWDLAEVTPDERKSLTINKNKILTYEK